MILNQHGMKSKTEIYQSDKGDWFSVRENGGVGIMGIFKLKVVQSGTIIVDGVDSLEDAEEYIESCNPVDDVKWSGFLEAMQSGIELQKISIPEFMTIREFADRILVRPAEIIKWLFLRGEVKQLDSEIGFDDMKEFADGYGFICERETEIKLRKIESPDELVYMPL